MGIQQWWRGLGRSKLEKRAAKHLEEAKLFALHYRGVQEEAKALAEMYEKRAIRLTAVLEKQYVGSPES